MTQFRVSSVRLKMPIRWVLIFSPMFRYRHLCTIRINIKWSTSGQLPGQNIELKQVIHSAFALAGADVQFSGAYPGWKPNFKSRILGIMKDVYAKEFGNELRVLTIHAGLECGIIGRNYPGMEMVSFGPTIKHPHSPDEHVNIATVQKFYHYLLAILKSL